MFAITMKSGFHMTFDNGWTVSVQFGPGNYCDNRNMPWDRPFEREDVTSTTAEIAAWDADNNWYYFGTDQVKRWVQANEVADFIHKVAAL